MHPGGANFAFISAECRGAMSGPVRLTDLSAGKVRGKRELRLSHEHLFSWHEFLSRLYSKYGTAVLD
jgi:hypothetical protein